MSNIQLYKDLIKQAEESWDDFSKSAILDYKLELSREINYVQNKEVKSEPKFNSQWQFDKYQKEKTAKIYEKTQKRLDKVEKVPRKWFNYSQSYINIEDITEEQEDHEEYWTNNYVDHLIDNK